MSSSRPWQTAALRRAPLSCTRRSNRAAAVPRGSSRSRRFRRSARLALATVVVVVVVVIVVVVVVVVIVSVLAAATTTIAALSLLLSGKFDEGVRGQSSEGLSSSWW